MPDVSICSPWVTAEEAAECCVGSEEADFSELQLLAASNVLFHLSGRQFSGVCTRTVHPCCQSQGRRSRWFPDGWPDRATGPMEGWREFGPDDCGCGDGDRIALGYFPLISITSITTEDGIIDPAEYRIEDDRYIRRLDGLAWPTCSADFEVVFTFGVAPPPEGVLAAARLACELRSACSPDGDCDGLSEHAQSLVRDGYSVTLTDPAAFAAEDFVNMREVDLFLKAHNPSGLRESARVISPDYGYFSRRMS